MKLNPTSIPVPTCIGQKENTHHNADTACAVLVESAWRIANPDARLNYLQTVSYALRDIHTSSVISVRTGTQERDEVPMDCKRRTLQRIFETGQELDLYRISIILRVSEKVASEMVSNVLGDSSARLTTGKWRNNQRMLFWKLGLRPDLEALL